MTRPQGIFQDLRSVVEETRKLNALLSVCRNRNDGGDGPMVEAISRLMRGVRGREWKGITLFQCPRTGYAIMKIPPNSYVQDFGELEEMAWEARMENEGVGGPDTQYKIRSVRKRIKRGKMEKRWCGCGCGERVYGKSRWAMGHNGRVEGWFRKEIVPPGLELDYQKWRITGCMAKLEELPQSGNI